MATIKLMRLQHLWSTVSRGSNIYSGSINNAYQFSFDASFNKFYSIKTVDKINSLLTSLYRACIFRGI